MRRLMISTVERAVRMLVSGLVGGLIVLIIVVEYHIQTGPDLRLWHTVELDEEFDRGLELENFDQYLELEERLFAQLDEEVYGPLSSQRGDRIDRYFRGSIADPARWPRNWNRSFELAANAPSAAVVMIHGMSDSPYSMRSLGLSLHAAGAYVLGMRVPGHGTAPSGLLDVEWQDMAAATRLAVAHARAKAPGRPLVLVGFSNGGALSVNYALEAIEDPSLPLPTRLILLSPEIGITKLAGLAIWQERLGHVLGLEKLAWSAIQPEYDPFKYGSFAINAGMQAHLITASIQARTAELGSRGKLASFPPTLAFQSAADSTVEAPVLVQGFLDHLPENGHELVLFDVNQLGRIEPLLSRAPDAWIGSIIKGASRAFAVTAITNDSPRTRKVVLRHRSPGSDEITTESLDGAEWPEDVYSLSHIALPFAPDDPVYGGIDPGESPGIQLGTLAMRGERGVLQISGTSMLRLRWNPFHDYVEKRTLEAVFGD